MTDQSQDLGVDLVFVVVVAAQRIVGLATISIGQERALDILGGNEIDAGQFPPNNGGVVVVIVDLWWLLLLLLAGFQECVQGSAD